MSTYGDDMTAGPWITYGVAIHDEERDLWEVEMGPDGWLEWFDQDEAESRIRWLTLAGCPRENLRMVCRDVSRWRFSESG